MTEGAKVARDNRCDFVIGLGGSSIDSAKAIAVMATNDGNFWDYVGARQRKGKPVEKKPLPIIAITTTAGTGTEAIPGWSLPKKIRTKNRIRLGFDIPVFFDRRSGINVDGSAGINCLSRI